MSSCHLGAQPWCPRPCACCRRPSATGLRTCSSRAERLKRATYPTTAFGPPNTCKVHPTVDFVRAGRQGTGGPGTLGSESVEWKAQYVGPGEEAGKLLGQSGHPDLEPSQQSFS